MRIGNWELGIGHWALGIGEAVRSSPLALASPFGRRGDALAHSAGGKRVCERLGSPQVEEAVRSWGLPKWSNCRQLPSLGIGKNQDVYDDLFNFRQST
ncbi:hypothetical protein [Nostoc sp. DSM 114159]